ncbi:MAG: AsnC family transcriptional regulator [Salinirussus sp.]
MRGLDDTDREILRLLMTDARRPFSEIADRVDLSAPAVSDRVDRLRDQGLIRRFTLDVDRGMLDAGSPVLITVEAEPGRGSDVADALAAADPVEHVFRTAGDRIVVTATTGDLDRFVPETLAAAAVREYDISPLVETAWSPDVRGADLAPPCDECGNTVTAEGTTERVDGTTYHFCCENCRETFLDRYRRIEDGA